MLTLFVVILTNRANRTKMDLKFRNTLSYVAWMFPSIFLLMTFASCNSCGKQEEEVLDYDEMQKEIIMQKHDEKSAINRMGSFDDADSISVDGHRYYYYISRMPDDSLGIVTDSEGYKTVDNAIVLKVKCDGMQIFSRRFTRQDFKAGISNDEFKHYVLMNMVFDRITPSGLRFMVSVGEAETDELFVQFALTIGLNGSINIARHEMFEEAEIHRVKVDE